jgi:hypothetical protein
MVRFANGLLALRHSLERRLGGDAESRSRPSAIEIGRKNQIFGRKNQI